MKRGITTTAAIIDRALPNSILDKILPYKWRLHKTGYATRHSIVGGRGGKRVTFYLHRVVMGLGLGDEPNITVDHINRNKLDCRLENLRKIPRELNSFALAQKTIDRGAEVFSLHGPDCDPDEDCLGCSQGSLTVPPELTSSLLPVSGGTSFSKVEYSKEFREFWKQVERWHEIRGD